MVKPIIAVMFAAALGMGLSGCSETSSAQPAEVGDCIQVGDITEGKEVEGVPTLACNEEHDGQVVHIFDLPDGDFPTNEEVLAAAQESCTKGFEEYVGVAFGKSKLEVNWLSPIEEGWEDGDRSVQCVAYLTDETTTESFEGAKI